MAPYAVLARQMLPRLLLLVLFWLSAGPAYAATCAPAASQGAAPASWQTYCWLDFSSYNDVTARSSSGQVFSFSLSDGSTLSFNLKTTSTSATGAVATTAPSWSGSAVGNTSFLGIPGKPILYNTTSGATVTFNITSIKITPPPGVASVTDFAFVVADGESTDNAEYLEYTTNGQPWQLLDTVAPISGSLYPVLTGIGTSVMRSAGGGQPSHIGAHIGGTNRPTSVTAVMKSGGLEGIMFAVRFASIKLNKIISGSRIDPTDQFKFEIQSASSSTVLASGTTTGTGNGPFPAAVISTASGIPINLIETMAPGSANAMSRYRPSLTCTNATSGTGTVMPNNVITSSYNFGPLNFGDIVSCAFTNTPYPHVRLTKAMGTGGRIFNTDQFNLQLLQGTTVVGSATTTGTGTTVTNGTVGPVQLTAGTSYRLAETAAGSTVLSRYTPVLSCTNSNGSSATILPTMLGSNFSPALGDVIVCVVTNTREAVNAKLTVTKTSAVISDGISGASPKAIPGAIVRYYIVVTNVGDASVDTDSIYIDDILPANMTYSVSPSVTFTDGTTPSGLSTSLPSSRITFSNVAGGGSPYTYTPSGTFDAAVKGIRIRPVGVMAASNGTNNPSFTLSFDMRVN
ncbi:MAG: CshA/CshB family fibrillar adhesin-related protein [Parasphingorhabdus sp.]|uniref:CshA/CshB family fibrillar adhesin-related protein n=1 Tax=Parasphingorhabdus sp. TaxID=2709688 RepID=UPI0030017543